MVLVDTSVWIEHFRAGNADLRGLLLNGEVMCHPFVIGELACGNLTNRHELLALLTELPGTKILDGDEVLAFISRQRLYGLGIGLVDVHLLASCLLSHAALWTLDKNLKVVASRKKILYDPGI
ncbi:MAG: PIN domain-containing protein [Nitrospiraceae bacterium]|nr:PIN domain-containing protein [Nitrospiraceae bacterium]